MSSKRKGLSVEEKRIRMLQIFHESKDFYQLKDLEKIAPKEKGIIAQSVKDVVQSLVDDSLIDSDKIGTSIYYWAYPSKTLNIKKRKFAELTSNIENNSQKLKLINDKITTEKDGKEDSEERVTLFNEIKELSNTKNELQKKLQQYQDNDPEVYENMKRDTDLIIDAVNRWTDNIMAVKSWCKRKFSIEENILNKQFQIPADLDYFN